MPLTSSIVDYDERWPIMFEDEATRLRPVFGGACKAIHHIGSTSVIGLAAKPEIDILVVVNDISALAQWQTEMQDLGYRRGRDLQSGHHFFKRDIGNTRTHKVHVCEDGHAQICRMLGIRDRLRANVEDRSAYASLKLGLEEKNRFGIAEYLRGKAPFLDDLYRRIQEES